MANDVTYAPGDVQQYKQDTINPPGLSTANSLFNLFTAAAAPQQQAIYNKLGADQTQIGLLGANQATQAGYLNQQLQNQLAGLGLQSQEQGIQQGALNRQKELVPQQQALTAQGYDITNQGYDAQRAEAQRQAQLSQQNLTGQAAAQGANNTVGFGRGLANISDSLNYSLGNLARSQQQTGLQQAGTNLGNKEQLAALQDAQKHLDILQQTTGLSKADIENRTQQALNQLGLSTALSTMDIYKAMADAQAGLYNPISQVLSFVTQLSGLNPIATGGYTNG